mgnify:CR=1 FL=1
MQRRARFVCDVESVVMCTEVALLACACVEISVLCFLHEQKSRRGKKDLLKMKTTTVFDGYQDPQEKRNARQAMVCIQCSMLFLTVLKVCTSSCTGACVHAGRSE